MITLLTTSREPMTSESYNVITFKMILLLEFLWELDDLLTYLMLSYVVCL